MSLRDVLPRLRSATMALLLALLAASPATAGLVIAVQTVAPSAGSTNNTLDVTLTNTGGSAVTIGGFAFQISVATGSGLSFTSVDTGTSTFPYIFDNHSAFGPDISNQPDNAPLPGTLLAAEDNYDVSGSGFSVAAGTTVGLGEVHFDLSSLATGSILVTLTPFPFTNLTDASGVDITASAGTSLSNGFVNVGSGTVPEPSSLALTGTALALGLACRRVRRRDRVGA